MQSSDLAPVLDLPGPITVFAPTSLAFGKMSEGHLEYLKSSEVTGFVFVLSSSLLLIFLILTVSLTFNPQGHRKLLELLRHHVVPSAAVGGRHLLLTLRCSAAPPNSSSSSPSRSALKLDAFAVVSGARLLTMANQALTVNVTEKVRRDPCRGLSFVNPKENPKKFWCRSSGSDLGVWGAGEGGGGGG